MNTILTGFLFAPPTALAGAAQLWDFSGSMLGFNDARTPAEADCIAFALDWMAVGADLVAAGAASVPTDAGDAA